jgi:AcrR family transcriptional regulator
VSQPLLTASASDTDTVLDAAAACYVRLGVARTTAADVARAAGISRATLYRRFGSHEAIFLAVLTRESEAMARDAEHHLVSVDDPSQRIVEGMLFSIAEVRRRPVHAALFTSDDAAWAANRALRAAALRRIAEDAIRPAIARATGSRLSARATDDLVDWILRLLVSFAAVPGPNGADPEDVRRRLTTLLVPAVNALLSRTPPDATIGGAR